MTRARFGVRKARMLDGINRGVSHGIKRPLQKRRNKATDVTPFGKSPPSPKVKPADRVSISPESPALKEGQVAPTPLSGHRFFRTRDLNRKATVSMSKAIKLELKNGDLVRKQKGGKGQAQTKRAAAGPFSPSAPRRQSRETPLAPPPVTTCDLLTVIDDLYGTDDGGTTPARPATPPSRRVSDSDPEVTPLRRSPRKHQQQQPTPPAGATPGRVLAATPTAAPTAAQTPLRRSPRKQPAAARILLAPPTHPENQGPTRLTLAPRRSPRKQQPNRTAQQTTLATSAEATRARAAIYDRLEEQLMLMEAGEDKENESPGRRKKDNDQPRFYPIFYRKEETENTTPAGPTLRNKGQQQQAATSPSKTGKRSPAKVKLSPRVVGRTRGAEERLEQMVIDAGQKQFGVLSCPTCGVVYTLGDPEDEALHAKHHTGYLGTLQHQGWKKENVVGQYMDGRVTMITPRDPGYAWKKVESVLSIVDEELGFSGIGVRNKKQSRVFFFVHERQIVGCVVAEPVKCGFPVIPRQGAEPRSAVSCSATPRACAAGVSRVWVQRAYRRRGIASRLIEAMRCNFAVTPLQWADVAFSDPTPDGLLLAEAITGAQDFLVYNQ